MLGREWKWVVLCYCLILPSFGQEESPLASAGEMVTIERVVDRAPQGAKWVKAQKGDQVQWAERIRTGELSRAAIEISTGGVLRLSEFTSFELRPPPSEKPSGKSSINFASGVAYFFSRTEEEADIETPSASLSIRGTEFVVEVSEDGRTTVSMVDGEVEMSNELGRLTLVNGEQGLVEKGRAPRKTAVLDFSREIQWFLYYPGIADPAQFVGLRGAWAQSLQSYSQGDILRALELLPPRPKTQEQFRYAAMVKLASGRVEDVEADLRRGGDSDLATSLRMLIELVNNPEGDVGHLVNAPATPAGLLVRSYALQASGDLKGALTAAREGVALSPGFGFGWARLAEMEFSFGRNGKAEEAIKRSLELMPRNAQALSLAGYLKLGRGQQKEGLTFFEQALAIDPAMGNAWLGRGLAYFQFGQNEEALRSMTIAAAVEPNRSFLRSYLGKAFAETGELGRAEHELDLAKRFDEKDPTPWLYSAIAHQRGNQPNRAIDDLRRSAALNDNRRLYRSQLLLDNDSAVRSANLASMFQNAGLELVAVREATRAVEADYTSASSHLFLANSFDVLRDPRRVQLRFETPWFNELLLANLFAPVGGGPLSQFVSQQEYSKLFETDGIGANFQTEWRSDDELFATASIFGSQGPFELGLDVNFRDAAGTRTNNETQFLEIDLQGKWQPNPDDIFYFLLSWEEFKAGDNLQTFDNSATSPFLEFEENQRPGVLLAGYNHRWKPGVHTLLLGGRLGVEQTLRNPESQVPRVRRDSSGLRDTFFGGVNGSVQFLDPTLNAEVQAATASGGPVPGRLGPDGQSLVFTPALLNAIEPFLGVSAVTSTPSTEGVTFDLEERREFEIYNFDFQQVFQTERNTLLFGGRALGGEIKAESRLEAQVTTNDGFGFPASEDSFTFDFARFNAYLYDFYTPFEGLTLVGGVAWDWLQRPENFRISPLSGETTVDQRVSGRAAFTYSPSSWFTARGIFSQGLGGISFDESVRLEPVQLGGFSQSFRTVLSESIAGSVEAPEFDTWGLSISGVLPTRTWWGVNVQDISQDVERQLGIFTGFQLTPQLFDRPVVFFPDNTSQRLEYEELQLTATLNQLIGDHWALGFRYRLTDSSLFEEIPDLGTSSRESAILHEATVSLNWNDPSGWFGRLEGNWFHQELDDVLASDGSALEGDSFLQANLNLGYRFNNNTAEIGFSVLNLFDQDYQLSPLTPFLELPRERTFVVQCRYAF